MQIEAKLIKFIICNRLEFVLLFSNKNLVFQLN